MESISRIKVQSVIKILYILVVLSSLVYATAGAQTGTGNTVRSEQLSDDTIKRIEKDCRATYAPGASENQALTSEQDDKVEECISKKTATRSGRGNSIKADLLALQTRCDNKYDKVNDGIKSLSTACGNYFEKDGKPNRSKQEECTQKIKNCVGGNSPTDEMGALRAFTNVLGMGSETKKNCGLREKDYFNRRKDIKDNISKLNKDLKTAQEDQTKISDNLDDKLKAIQKKMVDQQEAYDKFLEDQEDEQTKLERDRLDAENKTVENVRKAERDKAEVRKALQRKVFEVNTALIKTSEAVANRKCMADALKFIQEAQKTTPTSRRTMEAAIAAKAYLQKEANLSFNTCMKEYDAVRAQQHEELSQAMADSEETIKLLDERITMLNNNLTAAVSERTKRLEKMDQSKQKQLAKGMQNTQMLMAEMQSAQKSAQQNKTAATIHMTQLIQELGGAQADMQALGAAPDDIGGDDKSVAELVKAAAGQQSAAMSFAEDKDCCPNTAGKTDSDTSSSSTEEKPSAGEPWYHPSCKIARGFGKERIPKVGNSGRK